MKQFNNKALILGFGAVGGSFLPLFLKHVKIPFANITIIDCQDKRDILRQWINQGIKFIQVKITPANLDKTLSAHIKPGGLLIDLARNIDCMEILRWAYNRKALYINASIEEWESDEKTGDNSFLKKSLYRQYAKLLDMSPQWRGATTAVIDHGANPGLITHLTKQGLVDIASALIRRKQAAGKDREILERLIKQQAFNRLAMKLGVKVIHSSELDTQTTTRDRNPDEFINTWGIEAMAEESRLPVEIGWGTHEKKLPPLAKRHDYGPKNQIILPQMGMDVYAHSWVPGREYIGMAITHGETFSISEFLTVRRGKKVLYRPTMVYVYRPSDGAMESLGEFRSRGYKLQTKRKIITDEIKSGADHLGALIMGHPYNAWWTGSILNIKEARQAVPHSNATTVQVAAGVLAGVIWMLNNPRQGLCFPKDLPYDYILDIARPYLGKFVSEPVNWIPLANRRIRPGRPGWQFDDFVITT